MAPHHAKLPAYERELIGLVKAVRHWRPYLWGRSFVVRTDHHSLKFILDQRLSTIPQHNWVSKLSGYDLTVEYRPGKQNVVADALSRRDEEVLSVMALSTPSFALFGELGDDQAASPIAQKLRAEIDSGTVAAGWTLVDGLLLFQGRVFVPDDSALWPCLLSEAHEAGHEGMQKTLHRLRSSFYNAHLSKLVRDFVRGCSVCQRNKTEHLDPAGLLQPLPVPSNVWSDIAMDFIEGFPKVGGKSVILTVVDRFSKYGHFIPLSHPYTASSVARAFFDNIVKLHGLPCSIVSDRDPVFTSTFWSELFKLSGCKLLLSSAFHQRMNGQSEATNKIIAMYLRCLACDRPRSWLQWLPWAEYCYNTSYQSSLRVTPFRVVYGRDPPAVVQYIAGSARAPAVEQHLRDRDEFLIEIRERLLLAQDVMKNNHDLKRRLIEFMVGEWVWLRLHHRTAVGITSTSSKLAPRFSSPFQITARVGDVAYRLQLPEKAKIHNVFHVGLLKKFVGEPPAVVPVPLPPILHGRVIPMPLKVLRARLNHGVWELLIQWEGRAASDATWELLSSFVADYPDFHLEDELFLGEGGNVTDSFVGRVYRRRPRSAIRQQEDNAASEAIPEDQE